MLLLVLFVSCGTPEGIRVETEEVSIQLIHSPKREAGELRLENSYSETELMHRQYLFFDKKKIDSAIQSYLAEIQQEFKNLVDTKGEREHELHVHYQTKRTDKFVNTEFLVFMSIEGLVHPMNSVRVMTFNLDEDSILTLQDILSDEEFSRIKEHLKEKLNKAKGDYYRELDPDTLSFKNISYDGKTLSLYFNPYEVAPYYMGIQRFDFKGADFKEKLPLVEPVMTPVEALPSTLEPETKEVQADEPRVGFSPSRALDPDRPALALTFDDGPSGYTSDILDILEGHGARGSFFTLGVQIPGREDTLRRMKKGAHLIGNHTYNHRELTKLSTEEIQEQLSITDALVEAATGEKTKLMRPTYGSWDEFVAQATNKLLILWSVDTNDWKYRDAAHLTNHILEHAYDGSIILMHDIYESTLLGLRNAIGTLVECGYQLVTVEKLAYLKRRSLEPHQSNWELQ